MRTPFVAATPASPSWRGGTKTTQASQLHVARRISPDVLDVRSVDDRRESIPSAGTRSVNGVSAWIAPRNAAPIHGAAVVDGVADADYSARTLACNRTMRGDSNFAMARAVITLRCREAATVQRAGGVVAATVRRTYGALCSCVHVPG